MKLLLVVYGSLAQISGGYLYDREVADFLRDHGCRVDVLGLHRLPYPLCRLQSLNPRLRRLFRRPGEYDTVIVDELTFPSLCDPRTRRRTGAPRLAVLVHHLAVSEQSPPLPRPVAARLERRLLAAADAVLVNSTTTADTVRSLLAADKPIYVCPPGSDALTPPSARPDRGAGGRAGAPRLLVTGNVIPRKGHHLLLKMLADLRALPWELRVVGNAPERRYRQHLLRLIRREGLGGRVIFTGVLAVEDLAREYARADVFVLPSSWEGFGISLAEALRAGLPCLAFAAGAIADWVQDAELLVPAGDPGAFKQRLEALLRDPALRERAARAARRLAAALPTWEQTGRCFLAALQELSGRPAQGEDRP